jgi:Putative transposase/Transposase zinc-binding domain
VTRPKLEVADIFRRFGPAWRVANAGHLSLAQRRVMRAVELCRTAELGGHVEQCADCGHTRIAYNSCRNRHCPKCQWTAAQAWLEARETELLPVPYYHVVFTLPAVLGALAYQNKARLYGLLLKAAAETLTTIAADPKHLGARIGVTAVLHSWGQTLDHHPHVHCIVPAGGISLDGGRWIACRPGFFLPVRVLSRLFRRLFLEGLEQAHGKGELRTFGDLAGLAEPGAFKACLAAQRRREWVVYAKVPFAGPQQVLAYLARYTHRIAISNRRLVALDNDGQVSFRWKDYRASGRTKPKIMRLSAGEFMRRFLLHVLPAGFHRIRHSGLFANGHRAAMLARCRELLDAPSTSIRVDGGERRRAKAEIPACPCCGGPMLIIERLPGPSSRRSYPARKPDGW